MQVYHQNNILVTEQQVGEAKPLYALANTKQILPRDITASRPQHWQEHTHSDAPQA